MNIKSTLIKGVAGAFLLVAFFFAPKVAPHAWGDDGSAYVCIETNSDAVRQDMERLVAASGQQLVSCGDWHHYRVSVMKAEDRPEHGMTRVEVSFDVYTLMGENVTWYPTMSSGPYPRVENQDQRIDNAVEQIHRIIDQNKEGYLEILQSL